MQSHHLFEYLMRVPGFAVGLFHLQQGTPICFDGCCQLVA